MAKKSKEEKRRDKKRRDKKRQEKIKEEKRREDKRREDYSGIMGHTRTRLRFALLFSILVAVRGERGRPLHQSYPSSCIFHLISEYLQNECF